jgi:DNA repair exonuclease SbcCD ATPase subunit
MIALVASLLLVLTAAAQQKPAVAQMAIHTRAEAVQAMDQIQSDLATLDQHQQKYGEAAERLGELYSKLSKQAEQVIKAAGALKTPRTGAGVMTGQAGSDSSGQLMAATQQMQEMQMSFNLQYLQLQEQMQNENRQYTMVSNIMKTKHDTVKNSIANIR